METTITSALKEWATAVDALTQGKTIILLRKGGIREENGRFTVACDRVWLYPTYEHQKPELLKPEYAQKVTPVTSGWHPEKINISSWAEITDILTVSEAAKITALSPYHIWNEKFVSDRLKWKPHQPLYILLLRTYQLNNVIEIPYTSEYGGCKSWINLQLPINPTESLPILSDENYQQQISNIIRIIDDNTLMCS